MANMKNSFCYWTVILLGLEGLSLAEDTLRENAVSPFSGGHMTCDSNGVCTWFAAGDECGTNYFRCLDSTCIERTLHCDGVYDCGDKSDELNCESLRENNICPWSSHSESCPNYAFKCSNGRCVDRTSYCDGYDDCGDNSDEEYCNINDNYCHRRSTVRCESSDIFRCIPENWYCDGIEDCPGGRDETNCNSIKKRDYAPKWNAVYWLTKQKNSPSATGMWGSLVDKYAVALYLANTDKSYMWKETWEELANEASIQLLSKLSERKLQDIPSNDLASYVHAFLVTCLNPRKFHGQDIVQELRYRADRQNYTNPYVFLSLCNARETITESDKAKLVETFRNKKRIFWTDIQAVVVMALACASKQPGNGMDLVETLRELTMELKQQQYRNGTVENLQTTALVMQALISAEPDADPDNFDEKKALQQMLAMQKRDGSFGSLMNTYYVLPVLNCKSLSDINNEHCEQSSGDDIPSLREMTKRSGPKIQVRYSVWIGNGKDLERTLKLEVPPNVSLYGIMEMAADIDSRFRFEYTVKNRKPYVNAVSGLQDDPEGGKFWFLYTVHEENPVLSQESPADVMPKDNDHLVMWYRNGPWLD